MRYIIAALAGLVAGGIGALVVGQMLAVLLSISQAEGAYAMGLVFFWVPLGAITGAVGFVTLATLRR